MDPNEALRKLRGLIEAERAAGDGSFAADIVEQFAALDEWLTKEGFLPSAWATRAGRRGRR